MTIYYTVYESNLVGPLILTSDGQGIVGCWFDKHRCYGHGMDSLMELKDGLPVFDQARSWLNQYFAGNMPNSHDLPFSAQVTPFQFMVREVMLDIPYGQTTTYGAIAKRLEEKTGKRQSAQAVGGAVGRNPLCIFVPCHRVVGANGSLTGFAGGIDTKVKLLEHEGIDVSLLHRPKHGSAL